MEDIVTALKDSDRREEALTVLNTIFSRKEEHSKMLKRLAVKSGAVTLLLDILKTNDHCENSSNTNTVQERAALESNDNSKELYDQSETLLALSCLYHICDGPSSRLAAFVDKKLVTVLIDYIVPNKSFLTKPPATEKQFFQFSPLFTNAFEWFLNSTNGKVSLVIEDETNVENNDKSKGLRQDWREDFQCHEEVYDSVVDDSTRTSSCEVYATTGHGKTVNLADELFAQRIVWPLGDAICTHTSPVEANKNDKPRRRSGGNTKERVHQAAVITHVLDGNFFWAVVGEEKIGLAQKVKKSLQDLQAHLTTSIEVKKFDAVAAMVETESGQSLVRARVTSVGAQSVSVFGLDCGRVYKVKKADVHALPTDLNLIKIPPLAVLARVRGILPTPSDPQATELALGILSLILKHDQIRAVYDVLRSGVLNALSGLVMCPDLEVALRAIDLVTILISYDIRIVQAVLWASLVPGILATLRRALDVKTAQSAKSAHPKGQGNGGKLSNLDANDESSDMSSKSPEPESSPASYGQVRVKAVIESCLSCLANMMYKSFGRKTKFFQHKGLQLIIQVYTLYHKNRRINKLCIQVLSNYSFNKDPPNPCLSHFRFRGSAEAKKKNKTEETSQEIDDSSDSDDSRESLYDADNSGNSLEDVSDLYESSDSTTSPESSTSSSQSNTSTESSSSGSGGAKANFYVRGNKTSFVQDSTHELLLSKTVSPQDLSAIMCGMLNTGRACKIYFGIDPQDSVVHGVTLAHNSRDEFGMAVDQLMIRGLTPCVLHNQFQVKFVPVTEAPTLDLQQQSANKSNSKCSDSDECETNEPASNVPVIFLDHLYVVEIILRPVSNVIYCCNGNECFYRAGGQTVVLDCQLLRQLLILEEEGQHIEEIVRLELELAKLQNELAQLG